MDWDSLRQGVSFGVLDGLVKAVAGLVVLVVVVRAALRWLRFPDRFMDDDSGSDDGGPSDHDSPLPCPDSPDRGVTAGEDER